MGIVIYSILVESKGPGREVSGCRYAFGTGQSSPLSAVPWSAEQRAAVRRAVASYLRLPADMPADEREAKVDAQFEDPERLEFYLSGEDPDMEVHERAKRLYDCLRCECESCGMVVTAIKTN